MDQDLLAAAFGFANKAYSPKTTADALARLRERFPRATVTASIRRLRRCRCYGSVVPDSRKTHNEHAFAQGLFSSR